MSDDGYARVGIGVTSGLLGGVSGVALMINWDWLAITLGLIVAILGFLVELGIHDKGEEDEC